MSFFTLKTLLVVHIFKVLSRHFSHGENGLLRKLVTEWTINNYNIHITQKLNK